MRTIILMLEDNTSYVLKDQISSIEAFLKEHGYGHKEMNRLFDAAAEKAKAASKPAASNVGHFGKVSTQAERPSLSAIYLELLKQEQAKVAAKVGEPNVDIDQDTFQSGPEELISKDELDRLAGNNEKQLTNRDEGMIKVFQLLAQQLKPQGKDKARVIAARMKVDPDVYQMAGLGRLPEGYSDEDVWKTLDMAKGKDGSMQPFYDHVWQTFYTGALEQMQSLPPDTRDYIEELLTNKQETAYPTKAYDPNKRTAQDDRTAFEAKTLSSIVTESNGYMDIIPAGTRILIK